MVDSRTGLMVDEITEGIDELGVLLCGHAKGAYWYGSQLEINNSRKLVETNSATSLQVGNRAGTVHCSWPVYHW